MGRSAHEWGEREKNCITDGGDCMLPDQEIRTSRAGGIACFQTGRPVRIRALDSIGITALDSIGILRSVAVSSIS